MPKVQAGSIAAQCANPSKLSCLKYRVRPWASPAHTTITSFARSTPTVVISLMSSPSLVQIDVATQSWHFDAVWPTPLQGRGTPFYSLERTVRDGSLGAH